MLYELIARGRYFNQTIINRWHYVSSGTPASVLGSFGLVYAFGAIPVSGSYPSDSPFTKWLQLVSDNFQLVSLEARAASTYGPTDFYERPFSPPATGLSSGEASSPVIAYGFVSSRVRLDIRRATKRLVGVTEGAVGGGGVLTNDVLTQAQGVATQFGRVLSYDDEGNTITFSPAVVSKQEYTTPSGKKAYRYYPTLAAQLARTATGISWSAYSTVRSQTSRQYNRGA